MHTNRHTHTRMHAKKPILHHATHTHTQIKKKTLDLTDVPHQFILLPKKFMHLIIYLCSGYGFPAEY